MDKETFQQYYFGGGKNFNLYRPHGFKNNWYDIVQPALLLVCLQTVEEPTVWYESAIMLVLVTGRKSGKSSEDSLPVMHEKQRSRLFVQLDIAFVCTSREATKFAGREFASTLFLSEVRSRTSGEREARI
ncbi:hypothetical protein PsorP6_015853 [Peronosclerospora sorghi]|uniref:Uncharacterized protein n=1 Tax=Peronosclerospora sorghi TaxID=230839 RepID=A0ACC0WQ74_9STRA|nr:hypothetical protein PsorP6_015853 [Peronosclerospora sorghi]